MTARTGEGTLFYHVNDPTGTSLVLVDGNGDGDGRILYDSFGMVMENTLTAELTGALLDVPDAATGLVHLGGGRWYDPALGRPLQPNPAGGPPTLPQALNRYAATPLGQPGVYQASDSAYNLTSLALGTGFAKTFAFETAARSTTGILGKTLTSSTYHYTKSVIQLTGSRSFVERSRGLVEAAGGDLLKTSLRIRSGKEGLAAIRQATLEFGFDSPSLAADVAVQLNRQGGWAQLGHGVNVWSDVDLVIDSTQVPRFSILGNVLFGLGTDAVLGGLFQYVDDLQNPYFTPSQRFARAGISGGFGAFASFGGGYVAATYVCGAVPLCLATGGLVGGALWAFGGQPFVFEHFPGLQPERNLARLSY